MESQFVAAHVLAQLEAYRVQKSRPWPSQTVIAKKILWPIIQATMDASRVSTVSFQRNQTAFLLIISYTRECWLWNWICMCHLNCRHHRIIELKRESILEDLVLITYTLEMGKWRLGWVWAGFRAAMGSSFTPGCGGGLRVSNPLCVLTGTQALLFPTITIKWIFTRAGGAEESAMNNPAACKISEQLEEKGIVNW